MLREGNSEFTSSRVGGLTAWGAGRLAGPPHKAAESLVAAILVWACLCGGAAMQLQRAFGPGTRQSAWVIRRRLHPAVTLQPRVGGPAIAAPTTGTRRGYTRAPTIRRHPIPQHQC